MIEIGTDPKAVAAISTAIIATVASIHTARKMRQLDQLRLSLNEIIHKFGPPEIMNTDQGSQFTSFAWTDRLRRSNVRISMDGKGRFLDNVFVERLWRSLKYECVYLHAWQTGSEAKAGVRKWIDFYNHKRPHSALGGKPPAVIYWQRREATQPDQQVQKE